MSARPPDTYRVAFSLVAAAGHAVEIIGSATRDVRVTLIEVGKPSVETVVTFVKQSVADTGGTSTSPTIAPLESSSPAATAAVKAYTAAPTAGTSVGTIYAMTLGTGDVAIEDFGRDVRHVREVILRGAAQTLAVNLATGATAKFVVEFTEDSREL